MNTHDIDLLPMPEMEVLGHDSWQKPIYGYSIYTMRHLLRREIEADRKRRFESGNALQRYKECGGDEETDPIERLRFYCALAMSAQDWLDVEPFFDALIADRKRRGEPVGLLKCIAMGEPTFLPYYDEVYSLPIGEYEIFSAPQPAEPVEKPYPVKLHAWGGVTRYHDYEMSDGSIQTLKDTLFLVLETLPLTQFLDI